MLGNSTMFWSLGRGSKLAIKVKYSVTNFKTSGKKDISGKA